MPPLVHTWGQRESRRLLRVVSGLKGASTTPSFIPCQRPFSPFSVGMCLLHSCPPTNTLIRTPQSLFDIDMLSGFLLVYFFFFLPLPEIKHTLNTTGAFIKLILDSPQFPHSQASFRERDACVLGGWKLSRLKRIGNSVFPPTILPSSSSSPFPPPPYQQTRSEDQLRGRKREICLVWDQRSVSNRMDARLLVEHETS